MLNKVAYKFNLHCPFDLLSTFLFFQILIIRVDIFNTIAFTISKQIPNYNYKYKLLLIKIGVWAML